jgi:hypothetical protein
MAISIDLTFDCQNPIELAEFWKLQRAGSCWPPTRATT